MSKTVSKGQIFSVTVGVNDELLASMKNSPTLTKAAMQAGADYWHSGILPKHFQVDAHGKYDYALRGVTYRRSKHGKPDLVNMGSLRRDLKARAVFREQDRTVSLSMYARVLNFAPNMPQNSDDKYVQHPRRKGTRSRGYPNLKREIKAITDDEREAVAQVVCNKLELFFENNEGRESDD